MYVWMYGGTYMHDMYVYIMYVCVFLYLYVCVLCKMIART
jgi:hypothetical protein